MRSFLPVYFLSAALFLTPYFFNSSTLGFEGTSKKIDFASTIQPILARKCYACHGPDIQEGSIRFDDRQSLLSAADSGEVPLDLGSPESSEILRRILSEDEDEQMPPEGKRLSGDEVEAIRTWISQGAEISQHWSFQPIDDPAPPVIRQSAWANGSLDYFVLAKLEEAGLKPSKPASAERLIRRLVFDITGLPPSPEEVERYLKGWGEGSYEALIDQLLSDPAFGERWARMWLDVVRYAETNSFERDGLKPNAWKYRDYVIRAMNSDKPYDRFLIEQLAGDELEEPTADTLTATGYYRLGLWDDEPADPQQALFDGFDDLVTTTSQGMLGLTLNCARCHDHKIDPLTQNDYYAMVAFMRDVTPYGRRGDEKTNSQIPLDPQAVDYQLELKQKIKELQAKLRKMEQAAIVKMDAPDQRATEGRERARVLKEKLEQFMDATDWQAYSQLKGEVEDLRKTLRQLPPIESVLGLARVTESPKPTYVLMRGNPHSPGEEEVELAFPKLLGGGKPTLPKLPPSSRSQHRRLALARWIASKNNWMTARVIVNRIWLHYFGRGIVNSPNNFGLMGETPSHPKLLDFLASRLIENDWSLKSIHRMILLSSVYQQTSIGSSDAQRMDPNNQLLSHQNLKRLSAEQVRDAVLAVTGDLNQWQYGPSMYPRLSSEVLASQSRPGAGWGNSSAAERSRRSIYIHVKRSLPVPLLSAFDFPDTDISCEARFLTTQPGQALSMLNSDWIQRQSKRLLQRVQSEVGDSLKDQAARCLELATSLPANEQDVDELLNLVHRLQSKLELPDAEARQAMCLLVLNTNGFLYVD